MKQKKEDQVNYIVVEISNDTRIGELFEFESISNIIAGGIGESMADSSCYSIGILKEGNSVVWRSDDDGYGYDDCLFVYVEDKVSDTQVMSYAAKLKESPISYDSFKEKYK